MMRSQRTLKSPVACEGIGLHSGKPVTLTMKPAPAGTGIVFVRSDLGGYQIAARAENTGATSFATTLTRNGTSVATVEHVLSALSGLGIDNAYVEVSAEEVPIMDGSAKPFMRMIADAGIRSQEKTQPLLKIIKPVFVRDGSKQVAIWPADASSISYFIDYDHPLLQEQSLQYVPSGESYFREIADARTFGFISDVERLRAKGLAKGASLDNAVALSETSILNKDGLRYHDEFVRHKILDLIGDFALVGMPVIGHVVAHKSGHALNAQMVSKLLNSPLSWILIGADEEVKVKQQEVQFLHAGV